MRIFAVCRGAPGLGRVVPSVGLAQTLRQTHCTRTAFASYAAGHAYLRAIGEDVTDLGYPDGRFIDSVAPQALQIQDMIERYDPDLVLIDGEFFLPAALAHMHVPVAYLANPHDLIGPSNTFRRVNRLLLTHAQSIIISSLSCRRPTLRPGLVDNTPCLECPALTKDVSLVHHRRAGPPRVLISTGGGSVGSPSLREATDDALAATLEALAPLADAGEVGHVTVDRKSVV